MTIETARRASLEFVCVFGQDVFAVATLGVTSLCAARASSVKKVAAVTLLVATTATAQELSTVPVQELVLRNGFRLLVVEVPGAPRWRLVSGRRDR